MSSASAKPVGRAVALFLLLLVLISPSPIGLGRTLGAGEEIVVRVEGSVTKICQLIGDFDRERNESTISRTWTRFGVAGTDLGASFEHDGKLIFLFGDTIGISPHWKLGTHDDSFAYTLDKNPDDGLDLVFFSGSSGKFLPPMVSELRQGPFEVPMEGIDVNGVAYVYFTINHTEERTMGGSALARFNDSTMDFKYLYTFSTDKFLNVHVVAVSNSDIPGLPEETGKGLLIWGSGEYRKSDPYLAYMPLDSIEDRSSVWYFKGTDGTGDPVWSKNEEDAVALFRDPVIGEFSVAWNPHLGRWIMLYGGVSMRSSLEPWGPWSGRQKLFDAWSDGGYGRFIHVSWSFRRVDNVSDPRREYQWGGPYGPYMIDSFTEGDNGMSTIYFTLSTWNPYTVVLMKADLELRSAGEAPPDDTDSTSFNQSEISFKNETMQPPSGVTLRTPGQADITQTSVALTWTENTNVDFARYEVFQSSASGSLGSSVATILTRVSTECEVGGLSPDTTYYFTIRVFDAEGLCADSNQVGVRTKARFPFLIVGVGAIMVLALGVAVMVLALRKSEPRTPVPPPP